MNSGSSRSCSTASSPSASDSRPSDIEFIDSPYDDIFVNSALGWPGSPAINLPSGGPSPPLSVMGIRVKADSRTGSRPTSRCSTATRRHRDRKIRRSKIPTGCCFASTIRRGGSRNSNTNSSLAKAGCPGRSPAAAGTTWSRFPISASPPTACRWPIPTAMARPHGGGAIPACSWSMSSC